VTLSPILDHRVAYNKELRILYYMKPVALENDHLICDGFPVRFWANGGEKEYGAVPTANSDELR